LLNIVKLKISTENVIFDADQHLINIISASPQPLSLRLRVAAMAKQGGGEGLKERKPGFVRTSMALVTELLIN